MAIAQRKSHLRAGSNSAWKYILAICGIVIVTLLLLIFVIKPDFDLSGITNFIKTHCLNISSWFENFFSSFSLNVVQIILFAATGIILIYCLKTKNIILTITAIFYGVICFITFGGINIMNSHWFWILFIIAEIIAIIVSYIFTGDSFFTCCESVLFQLIILLPMWFIMEVLCVAVSDKGDTQLETLFYLIMQFLTFAVVLGYQLIMMFSDGSTSGSERDPVMDMTGDEDDSDYDDI